MPFARDTLTDLVAQEKADLAAELPGTDPLLPDAVLGVLATLFGETLHSSYGYLDWISRQAVPFTATDEAFEGWAALKGVTRKPATSAIGQGTFTGTPTTVLPAGTHVVRADGQVYVSAADGTVGGGGTVTIDLTAVTPGSAGTLASGSTLTLSNAIAGIAAQGVAVAGTPGVDVETFDAFRTRVLAIYANPPQGGSASDYVEWALQVPGVTRAWVTRNGVGIGTVVVYTMFDDAEAIHGGFPQGVGGVAAAETRDAPATQDLLLVADYIYDLQPVTALVYSWAPLANTVNLTINLAGAAVATKAAVVTAVQDVLRTFGAPGGVIDLSDLEAAIGAVANTEGFVVTVVTCNHGAVSPVNGNVTSNAGYLPVLGVITWV